MTCDRASGRGARPHEAAVSWRGQHAAFCGDAFAAQPRFGHAIRKLDALIRAPRHKIVSTRSGIVAIRIAPHEHNVGVAADGQCALDARETEERRRIVGEEPRGVSE